ncbi:MAG: hypothetical protein U0807_07520 [Candidatus Binatia bacterium]
MLRDADVDRWSRQILLPEVGGRGQERLCAARARIVGAGPAAALATTLITRAGVGTDGPADVIVALDVEPDEVARLARASGTAVLVVGTHRGAAVTVATSVGRPCGTCLAKSTVPGAGHSGASPCAAPALLALGALAAAEALSALLARPETGRRHVLDLDAGTAHTFALEPTGACPVCGCAA